MATPGALPKFPALDDSIGAFMIGTFLSVFLCFTYHVRFHHTDRLIYKASVYFLFVLDMLHSAFCCFTIYYWTVTHYGNPLVLVKAPWSFAFDPVMTAVATLICQLFFAYRVYLVSNRKKVVPSVITALSAIQFGFGMGGTIAIYQLESKFSRFGEWTYGVTIWLVAAALADILITGSLVFYLRKATSNEHSKTQTLVARIIRNTIETNGLTMIVAVADAILFIIHPSLAWHVIPNFLLVKLYFNSLLVSFNSREPCKVTDHSGTSTAGQVPSQSVYTKSSPALSGGTFACNGSTENGEFNHRVVVHTQSVIECEKSHPYTAGRDEFDSITEEGAAINNLYGAVSVAPRNGAVPAAWDEK